MGDFYIAGIVISTFLVPVTLTLIRRPSYMNLTHIAWRYTGCANMNFLRQVFRKLSSRQTDTQTYRETDRCDRDYKARHFACAQQKTQ